MGEYEAENPGGGQGLILLPGQRIDTGTQIDRTWRNVKEENARRELRRAVTRARSLAYFGGVEDRRPAKVEARLSRVVKGWQRQSQKDQDVPSDWRREDLERLHRVSAQGGFRGGERPMEGRLQSLIIPGADELRRLEQDTDDHGLIVSRLRKELDRRATLLTSEGTMYSRPRRALDWAGKMLRLGSCPDWKEMRPAIELILRQFYKESGDCIALVNVESCRESIGGRLVQFHEAIRPGGEPRNLHRQRVRRRLSLGPGVEIFADELRWAVPQDRRWFDLDVTSLPMQRRFSDNIKYKFNSDYWCLANRADDARTVKEGRIPLHDGFLLPNGVSKHRLVVFVKLDPFNGTTTSYGFDLDATSGAIYSIRYATNSLKLWSRMDAWFDEMVSNFLTSR